MVPYLTDGPLNNWESEKAWHIVALLLCIGRPACPEEIASKCGLFRASPEYVRHLCSIPGSPIRSVGGRTVTVSAAAVHAFKEFAVKAIRECAPQNRIRVWEVRRKWNSDVRQYFRKRKGAELGPVVLPVAKRRLCLTHKDGEDDYTVPGLPSQVQATFAEQPTDLPNGGGLPSVDLPVTKVTSGNFNIENAIAPLHLDSLAEFTGFSLTDDEHEVGNKVMEVSGFIPTSKCWESMFNCKTDLSISGLIEVGKIIASNADLPPLCEEAQTGGSLFSAKDHVEADEQHIVPPMKAGVGESCAYKVPVDQLIEDIESNVNVTGKEGDLLDSGTYIVPGNCVPLNKPFKSKCAVSTNMVSSNQARITTSKKDRIVGEMNYPGKVKSVQEKALPSQSQVLGNPLSYNKVLNSLKQRGQCKEGKKIVALTLKSKQDHKQSVQTEQIVEDSYRTKSQVDCKTLPQFESFIVEDEEGSGGYGTVYRAQSKKDRKQFAIKCPHENAHKYHVDNERKMLERFGGRNFIINYRGTFKSGDADCFILEHIEHEKPEILKKEIDIFELQWYGYCMFKALAYLHKQGVAHRDVKPGNFLFSRTLKKGYLIDFNLALDLQQKYAAGSKSKCAVSFDHIPLPHSNSTAMAKEKKRVRGESSAARGQLTVDSHLGLEPKNMKRGTLGSLKANPGSSGRNLFGSQGGDGSVITSTKDATSNRTPSVERLREPVPCHGRKELINLVQGNMRTSTHDSVNILPSQRKRVSAPPSHVGSKFFYLSPMPLHSRGVAVSGAGLLISKGDGKQKREGPCAGTKGFRAPEVLFRSSHQGFKVDVWSAGVTLLYLMVGRTPFTGDPEQNIKDVAKLRGSEDLWELVKLHNRESSFPAELFDIQSLPSIKLQEWCQMNTKRLDFLELIPPSLFDLIDKCLTVNPRLRIGAEEALRHEFFTPCHESLKKQRKLKTQLSLD